MPNFGPPTPLGHNDLIDLLRRNFDDGWIAGLLNDPSSSSIFEAMIAIALRVQSSLDTNFGIGAFILTAPGLAQATCLLRLQRPSGGAVTIPNTMRVRDDRGAVWTPTSPFQIGASVIQQTVDVPVTSQRGGYYLNTFLPPTFVFLDAPPDPNLVVIPGAAPAQNGTSPFLSLHGGERDDPRATGETDDIYRHRILLLDDQVSPDAIGEAVLTVLDGNSLTGLLSTLIVRSGYRPVFEPFLDFAQTAATALFGKAGMFLDDSLFGFCDDPHGPTPRSLRDALAWFDLELPTIADPSDARLFFDDGFLDDPLRGFPDLGQTVALAGLFRSLADVLDRKRAAGVGVRIRYGSHVSLLRHPPDALHGGAVSAGAWASAGSDAPPDLIQAVQAARGDADYAVTTTGAGAGGGASANDLVYTFAALSTVPISVDFVRLVAVLKEVPAGVQVPTFRFVLGAGAAAVRCGPAQLVANTLWQRYEVILETNPSTGLAWAPGDLAAMQVGLANVSAGATDQLRACDLAVEARVSFG